MPVTNKNNGNPIRNKKGKGKFTLTKKLVVASAELIATLTIVDCCRDARSVVTDKKNDIRIDVQGHTGDGAVNIQVQIGKFSVAGALVAKSVLMLPKGNNGAAAIAKIREALVGSLGTQTMWDVTGSLP